VSKNRMETIAAIVVLATIATVAITAAIVGSAENTWLLLILGLISLCGLVRHIRRLTLMSRHSSIRGR
jgi:hypothetical protein